MTDAEVYSQITEEINSYGAKNLTALQFSHPRSNVVSVRTFDAQMNILEWRFQFAIDVQIIRCVHTDNNASIVNSDWFESGFSHDHFDSWNSWDIKDPNWEQKFKDYLTNLENNVDAATSSENTPVSEQK